MNKRELVEAIAEQADASRKQVEEVLDRFMETVGATLEKGERVALSPFGVFERRERSARMGQNPQTGEKMSIPAAMVPAFKAGKALKDTVGGGSSRGAKKSTTKKSSAKKSSAKKSSAKKSSAKKAAPKKTAKKAAPKKTAKKAGAKKSSAKKAAPKKTAKKAGARKSAKKA